MPAGNHQTTMYLLSSNTAKEILQLKIIFYLTSSSCHSSTDFYKLYDWEYNTTSTYCS